MKIITSASLLSLMEIGLWYDELVSSFRVDCRRFATEYCRKVDAATIFSGMKNDPQWSYKAIGFINRSPS